MEQCGSFCQLPLELPKADATITLKTKGPRLTSECYHLCFKGQEENGLIHQLERGWMWMHVPRWAGSVEEKEQIKRRSHQVSLGFIDLEVVRSECWFLVESFSVDQNPKCKTIVWCFPLQDSPLMCGLSYNFVLPPEAKIITSTFESRNMFFSPLGWRRGRLLQVRLS